MKILHVCQNYYPSKGGPQYTVKELSERFITYYQDEVSVCTTNSLYNPEAPLFSKIQPAIEVLNNVRVHRLPFRRWHYPVIKYAGKAIIKLTGKSLPVSISGMRFDVYSPAMRRMMLASDADVIMGCTINYDFCNYPSWRQQSVKPLPFVLYGSVHLHKPVDYQHHAMQKARMCDCYIANTDFERDELIHNYGVKEHKIVTVGTGVDVDFFNISSEKIASFKQSYGLTQDDIVVGFVGRLVKGKGVAILLDAIRVLARENKNIKLLLAGASTDFVPVINRAIQEEQLPIILIENFDEAQKPLIYHMMDMFVLPSQSESFGVVFLEAWACKKPVLGTEMGATSSLLKNGKDSILFNIGNVEELVQQIKNLVSSKSLRQHLGQQGYERTCREFSWPAITAKFRDAYLLGIENFKMQQTKILSKEIN